MTAVLPAFAAAAVGGVLVGNSRGGVVHVAVPGKAGVTSAGRLRRGRRPLCGLRARAWRCWPVDGRPLCVRCVRHVDGCDDPSFLLTREQRAELLVESVRTARDEATWLACRRQALDLTQMRVDGRRVGEWVADARSRLKAEPQPVIRAERYRMRRTPAPHVRGRRPDPLDLLYGSTS